MIDLLEKPNVAVRPKGLRVSVVETDPGYPLWLDAKAAGKVVKVYLGGIEERYAITADAEMGFVDRYASDEEGDILVVGDDAVSERVVGSVLISIRHG